MKNILAITGLISCKDSIITADRLPDSARSFIDEYSGKVSKLDVRRLLATEIGYAAREAIRGLIPGKDTDIFPVFRTE